jgi:hypothetical protein
LRLPGEKLFGSGARDCKRFESEAEAVAYWASRRHGVPTVYRY